MATKRIDYEELIEPGTRRVSKHLDSLKRVILETAVMVFLISSLVEITTSELRNFTVGFNENELKRLIPLALAGVGGIAVLSSTILIFVYFLRGKTKKLRGLEVEVVSAFMKALDGSPLESHKLDKRYREQLNP